jgi:GNAT superfamily N-acetyltransferase
LVAIIDGQIVGVVFYETLENGNGHAGVFVDREYRGQGIGSKLLISLVARTDTTLEVIIFARNKAQEFYKKFGFVEAGPEFLHHFSNGRGAYLPAQRLILKTEPRV